MYNKFFGLAEAPFNITPDSRFLYLSLRHKEALSSLLYGIKERKGFIMLTGEIGSGKTTICRALVHELKQENIKLAVILHPGLSELELLKAINDDFQIPSFYDTKKGLIDTLNRFLLAENQQGNNVVLIIDEAQNLEPNLLEQIRILSNLETESEKLLQIVLMGQPELNDTMKLSQLEQLNQRIAVRYHITPLDETEMLAYIKHRLFVARAKIDVEFTDGALKLAFNATRGIPRKINVLCDRALLVCYVEGTYTVTDKIMQAAIDEVAGDETAGGETQKPRKGLKRIAHKMPWQRVMWATLALLGLCALLTISVWLGVRLANQRSDQEAAARPTQPVDLQAPGTTPETAMPRLGAKQSRVPKETKSTETASALKPAPTPPPDWEQIRKHNPNWKYDKDAPLVRVNNPKAALRAAQLSLLKIWGIVVDLGDMTKLGEDLVINGSLKSDSMRIHDFPLPGNYYETARLNVPVIVHIKNPAPNQAQYVVLLKAEGETVTVGDPIWGKKTYKTQELIKQWDSASAIFVDVNGLAGVKKGDRTEKVKALQQFLKEQGYLDEASGMFDVKTTEAIAKLQSYYNMKNAKGQLDEITLMILNSRLMRDGPKLTETE